MGLADVVAGVASYLTGVPVWLGNSYLAKVDAPPRVVFVPMTDSFQPARQMSDKRSLRTRVNVAAIHIWARGLPTDSDPYKNVRACEALLDRVVWAIASCVSATSYNLTGAQWPTTGPDHLGQLCVLSASFSFPVQQADADDPNTTATFGTFTNAQMTSTLDLPDPSSDPTGSPAP